MSALLSASDLQKLACFCYDVGEPGSPRSVQDPLACLPVGAKLKKARLPLAGTTEFVAPASALRVLVFAHDASTAPAGVEDPWQLACIDRPAFFVLADRFGYQGVTQVTVVEMDRADLAACGARVLDLVALDYVHGLFIGSFAASRPPYLSRTSFQEIMGNCPGRTPAERLVSCGAHDLDAREPEGPTLEPLIEAHRAEARLGELAPGEFDTVLEAEDGLWRCRARRHALDGHPALAFHEAQANFRELYRSELDARLIERLYSGVLDAMSPLQRDLIADQVWFGSLFLQDFEPVRSDEIDEYLDGMRDAYEQSRATGAGRALPRTMFERLAAWFKRRAIGDVQACATEIEFARSHIVAPFRYEFSASFDEESATARISLFLPQKALFPLTAANFELVGAGYSPRVLSPDRFEDRYTRLACRMGVLTLRLVKSKAPWLRRLELCAWYRGGAGAGSPARDAKGAALSAPAASPAPVCLYALSCGEELLARESGQFQRDPFETLCALGARAHRSWDRGLVPVKPLFAPEGALDHRFGFEDFRGGWTRPYPCRPIGREESAEDLEAVTARLEQLLERGDVETARRLGERAEERYRESWLAPAADDAGAFSCDSAFDELRVRAMLARDAGSAGDPTAAGPAPEAAGPAPEATFLPRGLSRLYVTLAQASRAAGSPGDARDGYERARELDPASPLPCFGLLELELEEGEGARARELADRAFENCYLARDLARAYRSWGALERADGEYETAIALYAYALAVSRDADTVEDCMREISAMRRLVATDTTAGTDPVSRLVIAGYPLHASHAVRELAAPQVERALLGGPLPQPSVLAAYLNAGELPEEPGTALENLLLCVVGDELSAATVPQLLFQPVILDGVLPSVLLGAGTPLVGDEDEDGLGVLAIPYLDSARGLVFDVRATVDLETRAVVHAVPAGQRVEADPAPLEGTHYLLARTRDYPELSLEDHAELLAEFYRADAARETTRRVREVDALRSFADPDEVLAVLVARGLTPEGVWVRLDFIDDERRLRGTLMSEPHDEFGLHAGDSCRLLVSRDARVPGGVLAQVELDDEPQERG